MASKRRKRRQIERICQNKVSYATHDEAFRKAGYMRRTRGEDLHVYKCQGCRRFHIGHNPANVTKAIEERREGDWV